MEPPRAVGAPQHFGHVFLPTLQNGFDPLHHAIVQLTNDVARFHVFAHLLRLRCAGDDRADIWIFQAPGER